MLAHILALTVGLLSFALYMSAFFFPEVYRKSDLTWSGIGLFYALVLWVCAGRITGGVLLGQTASVALLGWLGWQTINLRRELAPIALRTPLPNEAKTIGQAAQFKLGELKSRWQQTKLADQTNRLAGTIAGWTSSIAKPKQPPAVGSRSRQSKKSARSIAPAALSEPIVAKPISPETVAPETVIPETAVDAVLREPQSEPAIEPPIAPVRPSRPSGLFGGLRRNAPKTKAPKKAPKAKSPQRPAPPPEPSPDLEEFENWEDEETIDPAAAPADLEIDDVVVIVEAADGTIEEVMVLETTVLETEDAASADVVVIVEEETIEDAVVVMEPEAAIETGVIVETDGAAIENAAIEDAVVMATDEPSSGEVEVEVTETPPAEDAIAVAIEPADPDSPEGVTSPHDSGIEPEPPEPDRHQAKS